MCSLIVLRGLSLEYPILVAANRDESTSRKSAPPGLFEGMRRRILSPRDRVAGGTWLAVNDLGHFAGLTNVFGDPLVADAPSRGHLPHLALDQDDLDSGVNAVLAHVAEYRHAGFQLVLTDRERIVVIRNAGGDVSCREWRDPVLSLTNKHAAGEWTPRELSSVLQATPSVEDRLDAFAQVLCDRGQGEDHMVCKHGDSYATVSSSLVAVPQGDIRSLLWRYAPGPPDMTQYRNYSNLADRLLG